MVSLVLFVYRQEPLKYKIVLLCLLFFVSSILFICLSTQGTPLCFVPFLTSPLWELILPVPLEVTLNPFSQWGIVVYSVTSPRNSFWHRSSSVTSISVDPYLCLRIFSVSFHSVSSRWRPLLPSMSRGGSNGQNGLDETRFSFTFRLKNIFFRTKKTF